MRPIFFTLLFFSSFAFGQEMTQEEMAAAMQEEMACADEKPGKGTVVDSNSVSYTHLTLPTILLV